MIRILPLIFVFFLLFSCDTAKFSETSDSKFIGTFELKGRTMFEGIEITIKREDKELIGRISKLNDNKFVKLFCDSNDVWISEIHRNSNFEFSITENKIGKSLFSLYDLPTSNEFKSQFVNTTDFAISGKSEEPLNSKIIYKRIK
jgi:hypothetical protein